MELRSLHNPCLTLILIYAHVDAYGRLSPDTVSHTQYKLNIGYFDNSAHNEFESIQSEAVKVFRRPLFLKGRLCRSACLY